MPDAPAPLSTIRIITKKQLREIVPYSHQHIWRLEREGKFPRRVKLGAKRVGWLYSDIEKWVHERMAAA